MDLFQMLLILISVLSVIAACWLFKELRAAEDEIKTINEITQKMLIGSPGKQNFVAKKNNGLFNNLEMVASRLQGFETDLVWEKEKTGVILDTIKAGVLVLNEEKHVVSLNDTAKKLFKIKGVECTGEPFIALVRDYEMDSMVQKCIESGQKQTGVVELLGDSYYLELNITSLDKGVLVLVQDITGIRRLEKTRQDFIANISHELRTPIASCKAIVETLENGAIKEKNVARNFLQRMHVEIDKLAQMVSELSELSRIENGELPLNLHPVDLTGVFKRVVERLRTQADRANTGLNLDIPPVLPEVTVDENMIEQVLVNLVHNAIKFTPPNGKIILSTGIKGNDMLVSVTDTGIGIPNGELNRIFERFYKVDKARSGGGTGLGLAIAKHIVQAHGGAIWAESEERKGSTFIFSLPISVS